jgi:hypothetical protein
MVRHNWNVFFITLIICLILLLFIIIGILLHKMLKEKPTPPPPVQKVRILPDRNNKVILINDKFYRVDPGLYTRPLNYPGVVHHGPELVNLNS